MQSPLLIQFKAKSEIWATSTEETLERIKVPKLTRKHCIDPNKWRNSPAYGSYYNSDVFPNMLEGIKRKLGISEWSQYLKGESLPENVTIERGGFLVTVTIAVSCTTK